VPRSTSTFFVLAALEEQITAASAATFRTRLLAEATNGPVSPDADPVLRRNRVVVLTNSLTNAWGAIVTYFE
jgi:glutamate dehydrogenase/leucine dehydrogenase